MQQKKAIRIITKSSYNAQTAPLFERLDILPLDKAVVGKHPDLMVGQPTSTVFPTNDRIFEISQFCEKFFEKI